jgi:hypothetical protein
MPAGSVSPAPRRLIPSGSELKDGRFGSGLPLRVQKLDERCAQEIDTKGGKGIGPAGRTPHQAHLANPASPDRVRQLPGQLLIEYRFMIPGQ